MIQTDPLSITMGDQITCVVVIIVEELAQGHTLTNLEMYMKDPAGNEITTSFVEYQMLASVRYVIDF